MCQLFALLAVLSKELSNGRLDFDEQIVVIRLTKHEVANAIAETQLRPPATRGRTYQFRMLLEELMNDLLAAARANLERLLGPLTLKTQNAEVYFFK